MCPLALETSMLVVIAAGVGAGSGGSRAPSAVLFRRDLTMMMCMPSLERKRKQQTLARGPKCPDGISQLSN